MWYVLFEISIKRSASPFGRASPTSYPGPYLRSPPSPTQPGGGVAESGDKALCTRLGLALIRGLDFRRRVYMEKASPPTRACLLSRVTRANYTNFPTKPSFSAFIWKISSPPRGVRARVGSSLIQTKINFDREFN